MEQDTTTVLSQLERRMIALDRLVETNPASHLLHEYEALYFDRKAHFPEMVGNDDADLRCGAVDLLRRAEMAIRLMENLHLSMTED